MGKNCLGGMSKVRDYVYKTQLIKAIWGDYSLIDLVASSNWKYYYCSKCKGEFKVVKITEDEIAEGFKRRAAIVECKKCGWEVEMGFFFPIGI